MSSPNAKIIDSAFSTINPVNPKKSVVIFASLILGLLIPIGLVYVFDLLDNKISSKTDLNKEITVPYIGDIPKSNIKKSVIGKMDYSPVAEAFRLLRTNIDLCFQI